MATVAVKNLLDPFRTWQSSRYGTIDALVQRTPIWVTRDLCMRQWLAVPLLPLFSKPQQGNFFFTYLLSRKCNTQMSHGSLLFKNPKVHYYCVETASGYSLFQFSKLSWMMMRKTNFEWDWRASFGLRANGKSWEVERKVYWASEARIASISYLHCSLRSHKLRPFFHSFQTLWLSPLLVLALWKIGDEKYSIVLSFRKRQIPHTRVWFFNTMAKHSWRRVLKSAASSLLVSSSLLSLLWLNMLSISCKGLIYLADLKSNLGICQ